MTEPNAFDLIELATPYALNAVSAAERASIDRQLSTAPAVVSEAFRDEVRTIEEAMAIVSASTAVEPPEQLRATILTAAHNDTAHRSRWRAVILAAAAAIVVALAAIGVGIALRPQHAPTMSSQIMAAPDAHMVSGDLAGGKATVMFSRKMNAAVLEMNNVPPPAQGTVYEMWLVNDKGPQPAGTMNAAAMTPSMTHTFTSLENSDLLAFTVEPGDGSPQPTGKIFAKFSLR